MKQAHFVVTSVQGCLITICGLTIAPKQVQGSRVGTFGQICHDCEAEVKKAWVTVDIRD